MNDVRCALLLANIVTVTLGCDPPAPGAESRTTQSVVPCRPSTGPWDGTFQDLTRSLERARDQEYIPGIAAGVVCRDSLIWTAGLGIHAIDDPRPITPRSLFRIASLTKLFTATAVMRLVEEGQIALDDPITTYLPWFSVRPASAVATPITVRHLLTHTGGIPPNSQLTDFGRLYQPAREDAIAALPGETLLSVPGETYRYSNLGYAILGEIVRATTSLDYASYLEEAILPALGMVHTLVHPAPTTPTVWGHGPRPAEGPRPKAGFWDLGFFTPAGGMASSVGELSRFVRLQLAPYRGSDFSPLLRHQTLREMHSVQFVLDPDRGGSGLGWAVETSSGQHVVYHGGELPDQTSFLLVDTRALIGVVVLANAQDVDAGALAWSMLETVRDRVVP